MTMNIICPSGLSGEIRKLKTVDGTLLSDRSAARAGATFDRILAACWVETTDPGIYALREDGSLDWSKVLVADRFYTVVRIRALTFGDDYVFSTQCQSAGCRERFEWTLNLQELPVVPVSKESKAAFKNGNRFETVLPNDGRRVWFRLMTGADEVRAAALRKAGRDNMILSALAPRIVEIENVTDLDKRKFLDGLDMSDATALLDQFDAADGGVETTIEVECPACMGVQDVDLPFGAGFFLPTQRAKKAGR